MTVLGLSPIKVKLINEFFNLSLWYKDFDLWALIIAVLAFLISLASFVLYYRERRTGLTLQGVSEDAIATLGNNAKINYKVKIEKCILEDGETEEGVAKFAFGDKSEREGFEKTLDKRKFLEKWIAKEQLEKIVLYEDLMLNAGESIGVHLYDMDPRSVFAVYILLRVVYKTPILKREKNKIYIYRWATRCKLKKIKAGKRDRIFHPYDKWHKVFAFRE